MICISVTPTSRQLARVDLLNASRRCDLVELCLDHLAKEPDIGEMIEGFADRVIISCRRPADGGAWKGTEQERIQLIRRAIIAGPAWIELELDAAGGIPRFGKTKRVVSYTSLDRPLGNVDEVFYQAETAQADVLKFTWPTPTLDDAWPLLAAVTKKHTVPAVGIGVGTGGTMFSLLALKYGSPWVYAALERGMEAHPGQATVFDLDETYGWREINGQTRFVGVVGHGASAEASVGTFNAALKRLGLNARCLPMEVGALDKLAKRLETLKINALVVGPQAGRRMLEFGGRAEEAARQTGFCDLALKQADGWHAYNLLWRSVVKVLERVLGGSRETDRPLENRNVLVVGGTPLAQAAAYGVHKRNGIVSVTSPRDADGQRVAQALGIRQVPYASIYDTLVDVVVMADPAIELGHQKANFSPAYLRPSMTVLDLCRLPEETELLREARGRGCRVAEPADIFAEQIAAQFKAATGREFPEDLRWTAGP